MPITFVDVAFEDSPYHKIVVKLRDGVIGSFMVTPLNGAISAECQEVTAGRFYLDACFQPAARGLLAARAFRKGLDWFWTNKAFAGVRKLVGYISPSNTRSLRLAKWVGFKETGATEDGYLIVELKRPVRE